MAFTFMGKAAPSANTLTTVYTVPALKSALANLIVTNGGTAGAEIDIAISALGTPTAAEYIASNTIVPSGGILEIKGLYLSAGELVVINASTVGVAIRVSGDLV